MVSRFPLLPQTCSVSIFLAKPQRNTKVCRLAYLPQASRFFFLAKPQRNLIAHVAIASFLLAKAQRRKEMRPFNTNQGLTKLRHSEFNLHCSTLLKYRISYLVLHTLDFLPSIKKVPTNPQIQKRPVSGVVWCDEIAFLSHQTGIEVVVLDQYAGTIDAEI